MREDSPVIIVGAGPAGLTAAYELLRLGLRARLLERTADCGGLARTVQHKGYLLDIGGHAFFTRLREVERIWREVLGYFRYPLQIGNAVLSYLGAQMFPADPETTYEDWVSNRFGRRLYGAPLRRNPGGVGSPAFSGPFTAIRPQQRDPPGPPEPRQHAHAILLLSP